MPIKRIPLSDLQSDPEATLRECCDSGQTLVVDADGALIDELIETNPAFRAMLEKSKLSPRRAFPAGK